jgi:hypothetical protein
MISRALAAAATLMVLGAQEAQVKESGGAHTLSLQCDLVEEEKSSEHTETRSGIAQISIDMNSKKFYVAKWTLVVFRVSTGVDDLVELNDEEIILYREKDVVHGDRQEYYSDVKVSRRTGHLSAGGRVSSQGSRAYVNVEGQCSPLGYDIPFPQKKF